MSWQEAQVDFFLFSSKCPTGLLQKSVMQPTSPVLTGVCHKAPDSPGSPQLLLLAILRASMIGMGLILL